VQRPSANDHFDGAATAVEAKPTLPSLVDPFAATDQLTQHLLDT
jgi:hypothetical protein